MKYTANSHIILKRRKFNKEFEYTAVTKIELAREFDYYRLGGFSDDYDTDTFVKYSKRIEREGPAKDLKPANGRDNSRRTLILGPSGMTKFFIIIIFINYIRGQKACSQAPKKNRDKKTIFLFVLQFYDKLNI